MTFSNQLTNNLSKYNFIEFALLFGSFSQSKESYLSDVDIAVYTSRDVDIFTIGQVISDLESSIDKKIDLAIINDLYKKDAKLAYNITNNHKVLFCKNQKAYDDFKLYSLKYYFDMAYMYDVFDKQLLKRIDDGTFGKAKAS